MGNIFTVVCLCIRELIKGPMYYVIAISLCCTVYWRTSPIAIAAICNLCAGDGNNDSF